MNSKDFAAIWDEQFSTPSTPPQKAGKKVWAHHPRGGVVTGFASKQYRGLYGPEHKICPTLEHAKEMNGMSFPAHQVNVGEPPAGAKEY